jgi:hypothetical protein
MNWKLKFSLLIFISVPAFSGYPVSLVDVEIISGIAYGWVLYFLVVNSFILTITGKRFFVNALAVAALISMPVVFVGASVSYLIFLFGLGNQSGPAVYSSHYVRLCINMLTVIPLALSMIAIVPFQNFEYNLLQSKNGVSKLEKFFLMFLRVFNHIMYFVIPNILETVREEWQYKRWAESNFKSAAVPSTAGRVISMKGKLAGLISDMTQLSIEGICASIQYIPLWAVEISHLPDKQ